MSGKEITIEFGFSASKKYEEAVRFFQSQLSYFSEGNNRDVIHAATFSTLNAVELIEAMDLTTGYKTRIIRCEGREIHPSVIREGVKCFKVNAASGASREYCFNDAFGCLNRTTYDLHEEGWKRGVISGIGYIDDEGWHFNFDKIADGSISLFREKIFCPFYDDNIEEIKSVVSKLPKTIDPRKSESWAYTCGSKKWYWRHGDWLTTGCDRKFPGYKDMNGIAKITEEEIISAEGKKREEKEKYKSDSEEASKVMAELLRRAQEGEEIWVDFAGAYDAESCEDCIKAVENSPYLIQNAPIPGKLKCGDECRHALIQVDPQTPEDREQYKKSLEEMLAFKAGGFDDSERKRKMMEDFKRALDAM